MHLFSKTEIDQSHSLVVVFSELSELDKAAAEIKKKADYDSELFTKKECLQRSEERRAGKECRSRGTPYH